MQDKYVDTKRRCDHAQLQHHNVNDTPPDGVIAHADDQWVDHWQREYHRCDRVKDGTQREVEKQECTEQGPIRQAKALNPYVDFFYFDVWSSIKEVSCGIEAIKEFKKPYLVGLHISEGTTLPSGESIKEIKDIIDENALGVILACVSPENFEKNLYELKSLNIPFGFKLNGFVTTKLKESYTSIFIGNKSNPNEILGKREDLTPTRIKEIAKEFKDAGATIIGGCCETSPSHIEAMAKIK